ncbi:MAG: helix-turn-helix domain-containing protein [Clostridia bacterium]|nr:helix-turn-helix domain-containing protein [Clostridia bacterium]
MKLIMNEYTKGDIMRIIREWSHETQQEFGERIGKSGDTVYQYEANKVNYPIDTLLLALKEYGVTITLEKTPEKSSRN